MKPSDVYWDKPDLADDLREMADNLFPGLGNALRHAMLYSAAKRIEWLEAQIRKPETTPASEDSHG